MVQGAGAQDMHGKAKEGRFLQPAEQKAKQGSNSIQMLKDGPQRRQTQRCTVERQETGIIHQLQQGKFQLNIRNIFHCECGPTLAQVPREATGSPFLEILKTQQCPKKLDLIVSALRRGWTKNLYGYYAI